MRQIRNNLSTVINPEGDKRPAVVVALVQNIQLVTSQRAVLRRPYRTSDGMLANALLAALHFLTVAGGAVYLVQAG